MIDQLVEGFVFGTGAGFGASVIFLIMVGLSEVRKK